MGKIRFKSYFFDFLGAMLKLHNFSLTVYMLLNACLAVGILVSLLGGVAELDRITCLICAFVLYLISLMVMLSPVGEWVLRRQIGVTSLSACTPSQGLARLETIFAKVLLRAKRINPNLDDHITLFIKEDDSLNAFAMGRRTIVIHTGTLALPNDQIASVLAHEVGHISNKDTDLRLAITVGNVFLSGAFFLTRLVLSGLNMLVNILGGLHYLLSIVRLIFSLIARVLAFLLELAEKGWVFIGKLAINYASQKQELQADEFAVNCGCGKPLSRFLTALLLDSPPDADKDNILAAFMSTHPQVRLRLMALADLGIPIERADLLLNQ